MLEVILDQIDLSPAVRRQVLQQAVIHLLAEAFQGLQCTLAAPTRLRLDARYHCSSKLRWGLEDYN